MSNTPSRRCSNENTCSKARLPTRVMSTFKKTEPY